jgi:hypothetical protein
MLAVAARLGFRLRESIQDEDIVIASMLASAGRIGSTASS